MKNNLVQPFPGDPLTANRLLDSQERSTCEQLVIQHSPYSQRAEALLAIDQGATRSEAALSSGLTGGQVKYWLAKFRQERLAVFPEILIDVPPNQSPPGASEVPDAGSVNLETSADTDAANQPADDRPEKTKKKNKKGKKSKPKKAARKSKSGKGKGKKAKGKKKGSAKKATSKKKK